MIGSVGRRVGECASNVRARSAPLPTAIGEPIIVTFERRGAQCSTEALARTYADALPYPRASVDLHRAATHYPPAVHPRRSVVEPRARRSTTHWASRPPAVR